MEPDNSALLKTLFNYQLLTDAQLDQYQELGYVILPQVLTDKGREQVLAEVMEAWEKEKGSFDPNATWLKNALLPNVHHQSGTVRDFYFRGPLVDVAEQLIGPNIKGATSQLTFKMRGNDKVFGWHQDNGYGQLEPANAITTLTALEDNDEETGCIWIIPGSHKGGQIDVSDRLTAEAKSVGADLTVQLDDESGAVPMPLRAGDTLLFHCHLLHKSEGNHSRDRDRRVLFLRYADADAVELYSARTPRLGRLLRGRTRFPEVEAFESNLS